MKKLGGFLLIAAVLALATPQVVKYARAASCPGGSVCVAFSTFWTTFTYIVTGGSTARSDLARWVDNGLNVADAGVDCTGVADGTTALQAAVNAIPDGSNLWFPISCHVTLSSTITIRSRANIGFRSLSPGGTGGCVYGTPTISWNAAGGTVFDFEYVDRPLIDGLNFITSGNSTSYMDTTLNFDRSGSNPHSKTGTAGVITNDCFSNVDSTIATADYTAVYIAPTTGSNEENFLVDNISVSCGTTVNAPTKRAADGVTNGTTTLTSATASFISGDAGATIFVTYPGFFLRTTIASVTNGTTVVLMDAVSITQTGVQINTGQYYGNGIQVGNSANSIQHRFRNINYTHCDKAIYLQNGSADIYNPNGGSSDWAVYVNNSVQPIKVDLYSGEGDMRAIEFVQPSSSVQVSDTRLTNDNQFADGFIKINGHSPVLSGSANLSYVPTSGQQILIGFNGSNPALTSIANSFYTNSTKLSWTQIGYSLFNPPVTTINDGFDYSTGGPFNFGCFISNTNNGATNCVTISSNFGHQNSAGLSFNTVKYFSDSSYYVMDMQAPTEPTVNNKVYHGGGSNAVPTCTSALNGARATVSDATSPTYLGTYTNGGAVTAPVFCNGSTWLTD